MKKYIISLLVATVATTVTAYAQVYVSDAFRFSQMNYGSTARFKAMGGAQIGVGGDIGSIGANPAGLGLFTKSEFSLTPEFNSIGNKSAYLGNNTNANKNQLNLNNIGLVFYSPTTRYKADNAEKGLVSGVFGISYNRNNDFFNNIDYAGINTNNTIRDAYAEQATNNGISGVSPAGDAYNALLINRGVNGNRNIFTADPTQGGSFNQNYAEAREGSTSEFNLAGALNFGNKFYIGGTVSFVNVRYISNITYLESGILNNFDETRNPNTFNGEEPYNMVQYTNQRTKGAGLNIKLGMIFRPINELRIGVNIQSPTWMNIEDNSDIAVNNSLSGFNSNNSPGNYYFSYNLRTPFKASAGLSYVIANRALISADVDYVDYSTMRFSDDGTDGSDLNTINAANINIKESYKETVNYRVGAEVKLDDHFSLRAGYGLNGNAIKGGKDSFYQAQYYTGGLGYRFDNYYLDFTYQNLTTNFNSSPYLLDNFNEPVADVKSTRNNVFLTFGVRF